MTKHNILSHYRLIGDHPADLLIQSLVDENGIEYIRSLFPFFSNYKDLSFGNLDPLIQDFLKVNSNLPASFDKKNMIRATDYYRNNQENIGLVLGLYSLPYCYLGADGARDLSFSARLNKDAFKRLVETGNFLKAVLNHDNWSEGKIFAICIKVRLLHASIRYFILKSDRWDMKWGYPINQEDLVGTNLAFSLIVLRGMEKLGLQADDSVNAFRSIVPNEFTAELLQEQSRFLLGENYANMLEIKTTTIPKSVLSVYNKTSALMSKIF